VGNRISQQTSSAQPLITQATVDTLDDANRLIRHGSTTLTYDANGNLISEVGSNGTSTYTWDARNRLRRVTDPSGFPIQLQYDFAGNLLTKVVGTAPGLGGTTSYTVDEVTNVASQRVGGNAISVLTGDFLDSHLATVGATGTIEYALTDAVNSTVATVDQAGNPKGQFSYELFGQTTSSGSAYSFQYTGRVPLNAAVYYYRARYYSPTLGRFISEDPIGFAGGTDLYTYVGGNPMTYADPLGLKPVTRQSCAALQQLIEFDDQQSSALGTLYSHDYNALSFGEKILNLNATFVTIGGPVDADWMLRSAAFGAGYFLLSEAVYNAGKVFWNVVNGSSPTRGMSEPGHKNAAAAAEAWLRSGKSLREIFAPALKQCGCMR